MPVSESQYLIVITSKTGWAEEYVRWWLPLSRGWAHYHTARMLNQLMVMFQPFAEEKHLRMEAPALHILVEVSKIRVFRVGFVEGLPTKFGT